MQAASVVRQWLARNATGVGLIRCDRDIVAASACASLIYCLPALEIADLQIQGLQVTNDMGCMIEALAGCSRLRALSLSMWGGDAGEHPFL